MTVIDAALTAFAEAFPGSPDGVWSAPGRVNLIGEHTDYNDGFAMPFAIDRRTAAAVRRTGTGEIRVTSTETEEIAQADATALASAEPTGWSAYPLGVAQILFGDRDFGGFDIAIASEVPVGSGLSSSAAIECAVALALDDLTGLGSSREDLARICRSAENDVVGAPTGVMDQYASLFGRPDSAVLLDCRTLAATPVTLGLHDAGLVVLVIDTRESHTHASNGYAERRASCELGASTLGVAALRDLDESDLPRAEALLDGVTFRRVRHIVTEDARVLRTAQVLETDGPRAIGDLLLASHASMRDDFAISTPALDAAVQASVDAGAIGARMTGGGFGGCAIALVPAARLDAVERAVVARFASDAHPTPRLFAVRASEGARRDA